MSKFVQKPVEVEAVQFNGSYAELRQALNETWGEGTSTIVRNVLDEEKGLVTQTWDNLREEWITLEENDWFVKAPNRNLLVWGDDHFREKHNPMDEDADDTLEENAPPTVETDDEFDAVLKESTLREELSSLLNRLSRENESGTADFVLAHFLIGSLETFEESIKMRAGARSERWQYDIPSPITNNEE
jgi:hypothetical protein